MKALILAAGYGKRLSPITDTIPKSMIEVGGTPLLVRNLNNLVDIGIAEIGIVTGHMSDYIRNEIGDTWGDASITYFENPRYLETNNVVSLYCAKNFCSDDMLLLECDICYDPSVLKRLVDGDGECNILVSKYNPATMDGTVIHTEGSKAQELIIGKWQEKDFCYDNMYKTVNMYFFKHNFLVKYMQLISWYVENMGEQSYYEKILGSMIYLRECDICTVEVEEVLWCEIDDISDLERARNKFSITK